MLQVNLIIKFCKINAHSPFKICISQTTNQNTGCSENITRLEGWDFFWSHSKNELFARHPECKMNNQTCTCVLLELSLRIAALLWNKFNTEKFLDLLIEQYFLNTLYKGARLPSNETSLPRYQTNREAHCRIHILACNLYPSIFPFSSAKSTGFRIDLFFLLILIIIAISSGRGRWDLSCDRRCTTKHPWIWTFS